MKIGLLTAIREDAAHPFEYMYKRIMANLGPLYLAAYLEKTGSAAEVYIKDRLEDLAALRPEVLGISAVTENIEHAKDLARRAKAQWNPLTILGGAHLTALPHALPAEFDVGVIGEGEETFVELVSHVEKHGFLQPGFLSALAGICYWREGRVCQNPFRKGLDPLDQIPPPARHRYLRKTGVAYMMTSRGCPYTCSFCTIPAISEGYRKHSPAYVVAEMRLLRTHFPGVAHVRLFDDLFIVDRKRVKDIAERVEAEGLNRELSFGCWGRANLIDDEMLRSFKRMNMLYVAFGAESGSSRVLSQIKPGSSVEQNQAAIDRLCDAGVRPSCSVILGHPLETEEDLWATYEFLQKNLNKLHEIELNVAIPWPGTALWDYAKRRGLVHEAMNFETLRESAYFPTYRPDKYPYLNEHISPARFDDLLDSFRKLYYEMQQKMKVSGVTEQVHASGEIAALY